MNTVYNNPTTIAATQVREDLKEVRQALEAVRQLTAELAYIRHTVQQLADQVREHAHATSEKHRELFDLSERFDQTFNAASNVLNEIDNRSEHFNRVYLGVRSTDPSPTELALGLVDGAWYFNQATQGTRVFTRGSWRDAISPSVVDHQRYEFVAEDDQSRFNLPTEGREYAVYVNGLRLPASDWRYAGGALYLGERLVSGDDVVVDVYGGAK